MSTAHFWASLRELIMIDIDQPSNFARGTPQNFEVPYSQTNPFVSLHVLSCAWTRMKLQLGSVKKRSFTKFETQRWMWCMTGSSGDRVIQEKTTTYQCATQWTQSAWQILGCIRCCRKSTLLQGCRTFDVVSFTVRLCHHYQLANSKEVDQGWSRIKDLWEHDVGLNMTQTLQWWTCVKLSVRTTDSNGTLRCLNWCIQKLALDVSFFETCPGHAVIPNLDWCSITINSSRRTQTIIS